MTNTNSLPLKYSSFFRFVRLIKRSKSNPLIVEKENPTNQLKELVIEDIEICNNSTIQKLFVDLIPYKKFINIYLHGSWADNTKTPFSDLDDFIILDVKGLEENGLLSKVFTILNKIDMQFCRMDPIQHHGHWICSKEDLNNYDNSFMPLHICREAKIVLGNSYLKGHVNPEITQKGLKRNIVNTCKGIKKLSNKLFDNAINAYQLKGLVGSFVLIPAFIMQLKGFDYTKPEAIKVSKSIFTKESLSCILWSTNSRNNWSIITDKPNYKLFGYVTYLHSNPHLWRRFSGKFSPKVKLNTIKRLSDVALAPESVNKFILESLNYAK